MRCHLLHPQASAKPPYWDGEGKCSFCRGHSMGAYIEQIMSGAEVGTVVWKIGRPYVLRNGGIAFVFEHVVDATPEELVLWNLFVAPLTGITLSALSNGQVHFHRCGEARESYTGYPPRA